MCSPTVALVATAVGTAMQAYSQHQSGKYNAKVARNNAMVQNRMAEDALKRGDIEEQRHRDKVAQFKSQQRAAMGAAGIDLGSGSALNLQADTAMMGELDALTIRSNAEREAYGHRVAASNAMAQSRLSKSQSVWQPIGTIMTGAGQVGSQWYGMGKPNPFTKTGKGPSPIGTNYGGWTP